MNKEYMRLKKDLSFLNDYSIQMIMTHLLAIYPYLALQTAAEYVNPGNFGR